MNSATSEACILYLSSVNCLGGAERSLLDIIESVDRRAYRPVVALPGAGPLNERLKSLRIETLEMPFPRLHQDWRPLQLLHSVQLLRKAARKLRLFLQVRSASIIHANGIQAMMCAAFIRGVCPPILWHVRDRPMQPRFLIHRLARKADRIVAISSAMKGELEQFTGDQWKVQMVLNGIDTAPFEAVGSLTEVTVPTVGMIANFYPWKGHREFLQIAAKVLERLPEARFLIAGSDLLGEQPKYFEELLVLRDSLNLSDKVEFCGQVADVAKFLSGVQVLAMASQAEPFGRCAVEAMAAGRPVVSWASGGPLDIIQHGKTGLLIEPGDSDAFAGALAGLLASVETMEAMGQAGRADAKCRFHRSVMAREIEGIYEEMVS